MKCKYKTEYKASTYDIEEKIKRYKWDCKVNSCNTFIHNDHSTCDGIKTHILLETVCYGGRLERRILGNQLYFEIVQVVHNFDQYGPLTAFPLYYVYYFKVKFMPLFYSVPVII